MKRLSKLECGMLFIWMFLCSCVYQQKTHINDEELEWITNRHEGEILYFKSQNGDIDTVTIKEISIHNSLDPINWGYFNTSNKEYIATAEVRYAYNHDEGGILQIEKKSEDKPIFFSSILIRGWLYDVSLKLTSLRIDGITMNDIMFFDNTNLESINQNDSIPIINYAWSKKYGLVQYTFQNGTIFSRSDIKGKQER